MKNILCIISSVQGAMTEVYQKIVYRKYLMDSQQKKEEKAQGSQQGRLERERNGLYLIHKSPRVKKHATAWRAR